MILTGYSIDIICGVIVKKAIFIRKIYNLHNLNLL